MGIWTHISRTGSRSRHGINTVCAQEESRYVRGMDYGGVCAFTIYFHYIIDKALSGMTMEEPNLDFLCQTGFINMS